MTPTAPARLLATIARALAPAGWMLGAPLPIQAVTTWQDVGRRDHEIGIRPSDR